MREVVKHYSRNLSIIPEIESVIENSNYEEKEKERLNNKVKQKKEISENLYKILGMVMAENEYEKAEFDKNYAKIIPIYNRLRSSTPRNNYFISKMFEAFIDLSNYKSMVVLVAENLDFLEQKGLRKISRLPFWIQKYVFTIIEDKGLKYLNDLLEKMNFYD